MPLTPVTLVDHLGNSGMLGTPSESPWPTIDPEEQDLFLVNWDALYSDMPQAWDFVWDRDNRIERAIEAGPPSEDEAGEITERRADVCAWYQPIHFHGLDWGIFILDDCLQSIAVDIARWLRPTALGLGWGHLQPDLLRAAFATLYLHEAFHHRTESLAIRCWSVDGVPRYRHYFDNVYRPTFRSPGALEEALANASSYKRLSEPAHRAQDPTVARATRDYLSWTFPHQPAGYRDAPRYMRSQPAWEGALNTLSEQVATARVTPPPLAADRWTYAPNMTESYFGLRSDIWLVVPRGSRPAAPHFPLLRTASSSDLIAGLKKVHGYAEVKGGGKGSHVRLRAVDLPPLTIPGRRKDLSPQVMKSVAKALQYRDSAEMLAALGC